MLSEPARSPYDWEFSLFGYSVRVTWLFWLISAAWGYAWARGLDALYFRLGLETPGMPVLLCIWIAVSFVSILVHELGHTIAMKYFGISSYIVLYHFGGLAIPEGRYVRRTLTTNSYVSSILISLAGPIAQLSLGLIIAMGAFAMGLPIGSAAYYLQMIGLEIPLASIPQNAATMALIEFSVHISIFWALINLLPILPLDGGRIAQNLIGWQRGTTGIQEATVLSLIVCGLGAYAGFQIGYEIMAFNFIVLGFMNFQSLQMSSNRPW